MKMSRTIFSLLVGLAVSCSWGQAWSDAYNKALGHVREQQWMQAREAFKSAVADRGDDQSGSTRLPGPVTAQRVWRNGSPYSPNFGAAYTGFKAAAAISEEQEKSTLLREIAAEFEALIAKGNHSKETYFFLGQTYALLRDVQQQQSLDTRMQTLGAGKLNFKIDPEIIQPEDLTAVASTFGSGNGTNNANTVIAGTTNPTGSSMGTAAKLQDKFALLIGNSETKLDSLKVGFAANDAQLLREKLVQFAGYEERNVDVVQNANVAQMRASIAALAERATPESTVFLFFSGVGVNLDGKDYLAGIETGSATDSSAMLAKMELYQPFIKKGCKIFAFFQVNRPIVKGYYFGKEEPMFGAIAQTQATIPGATVGSIVRTNATYGLFSDAMGSVLQEIRSNRVPVLEFAWQVSSRMKGSTQVGTSGGGSNQTLTLPVIINMDPERTGF